MGRFDGQVVWITGASSGLGAACAETFAREGALVVCSARRADKLDEVVAHIEAQGGRAEARVLDVTDDGACAAVAEAIVADHGGLDVVLANAGFGVAGPTAKLSDEVVRRQFDVNVFGLLNVVRAATPSLVARRGRLALVGSVAAFAVPPKNGLYAASKAAVHALGQALDLELAPKGVSVTTIHPGFVVSEIARVDNEGQHDPSRKDPRPGFLMWPTDRAARVMVRAIHARKRVFVFTGHGRFAVLVSRLAPGLLRAALARS